MREPGNVGNGNRESELPATGDRRLAAGDWRRQHSALAGRWSEHAWRDGRGVGEGGAEGPQGLAHAAAGVQVDARAAAHGAQDVAEVALIDAIDRARLGATRLALLGSPIMFSSNETSVLVRREYAAQKKEARISPGPFVLRGC